MGMNKNELLSAVLLAREEVEKQEASLSAAKKEKQKVEEQLLELMELTGEKSFKTEDGINVIRKETLYARPYKDKKEEVYEWVDEVCGRSDIIKKTIHNKTFTSFISQRLKDKLPIPSELIESYFKPELTIRGGK